MTGKLQNSRWFARLALPSLPWQQPHPLGRGRIGDVAARSRLIERHQFATSSVERKAASALEEMFEGDVLAKYSGPIHRQFMFRFYWTPRYCIQCLKQLMTGKFSPLSLLLWEHGTYLLAFERMHAELVLSGCEPHAAEGHYADKPACQFVGRIQNLPLPCLDTFERAAHVNPEYWAARFEEWRCALLESIRHAYGLGYKGCEDTFEAAMHGIAFGRLPNRVVPAGFESAMVGHFEALGQTHLATFHCYRARATKRGRARARGSPSASDEDRLRSWLTGIWPLVRNRRWGSRMIQEIAKRKFGRSHQLLLETDQVGKLCEGWRLRLHGSRSPGGRPTKGDAETLNRDSYTLLAVELSGITELGDEWMKGQCDLLRKLEADTATELEREPPEV